MRIPKKGLDYPTADAVVIVVKMRLHRDKRMKSKAKNGKENYFFLSFRPKM